MIYFGPYKTKQDEASQGISHVVFVILFMPQCIDHVDGQDPSKLL